MEQVIIYVKQLIPRGAEFVLTLIVGLLVFAIGSKVIKKILKMMRRSMERKELEQGVVTFVISASKIAFYVFLIIVVAQIFGFATSSIIAIVGSAGLAIGLALQGSLANFAGGVLILVMKPFRVGEYIIVGDMEGTVEKIDVVYTTLHTNDNAVAILPNGKLADSNILNVTREEKRRIDIKVGIEYGEDIKRVREVLQSIVDRQTTRLNDTEVTIIVSSLDESAITMEVRIWVKPKDYWPTRSNMLEQISEEFRAHNIVIPFNQLDVHVNN